MTSIAFSFCTPRPFLVRISPPRTISTLFDSTSACASFLVELAVPCVANRWYSKIRFFLFVMFSAEKGKSTLDFVSFFFFCEASH